MLEGAALYSIYPDGTDTRDMDPRVVCAMASDRELDSKYRRIVQMKDSRPAVGKYVAASRAATCGLPANRAIADRVRWPPRFLVA